MKITRAILKVLRPIIKFIDAKIIIEDFKSSNFYSYSFPYGDDLDPSPNYSYDLDPVANLKDGILFKEKEVSYSLPSQKHVIDYYKENDKIVKGIMISINVIKSDSRYFGDDTVSVDVDGVYNIPILQESSSTAVEIYVLRDGRIAKFDRFMRDDFLFDLKYDHSRQNFQELSVEQFLQYDSAKRVLNNVLLAYDKAIIENENKFPILKKSLEAILQIKKKFSPLS